ncbi:MAG: hypothetical protein B7X90_01280 [Novosphingobium sp. 17-62-19]|uniref:DUF5672 family protein n=1 Tax=Novosphingobium sp. 17-62-19 TaxID=1970406 RepID=UPI000BD18359|nr:DUF5672 family protein [Novosphingobium sp. 17-62-19]OYX95261.1 MAG: hypothetical protein B7Y74_04775 [Novosphingobium sp. 35-62-5]OZA21563.1 MAG: hypothetical protein B7X90_01280 [Novosphingobium sp. 17-62-19]HQS95142.1 DUF5672 family protein [Novosphingobium sp.]
MRLTLPNVTLCAVTSINVAATVQALTTSMAYADFGAVKLFTDVRLRPDDDRIEIVPIDRLTSSKAYSAFLLAALPDHIETSHCLVTQWDGHVISAENWRPAFLDYDYVGASWPQFSDGHDVGNGGFSLRSRRLMDLCRDKAFNAHHPEDVAICRTNRPWLESIGMCFAPKAIADQFAAERTSDPGACFGYHGVWNMPRAIGMDAFWSVYQSLDDRGTIWHDFGAILRDTVRHPAGFNRAARMLLDRIRRR